MVAIVELPSVFPGASAVGADSFVFPGASVVGGADRFVSRGSVSGGPSFGSRVGTE